MNPDEWLKERARDVRDSVVEVKKLAAELEYLQTGWRPPDGGWSIAQVFEHLIIADTSYFDAIRRTINSGRKGRSEWRPSFFGGWLARALDPKSLRKVPAPGIYKPPPQPRAHVIEEYAKVREEVAVLIDKAHGVDLRRNKLSSPVNKLIRVNLGDAFMISVVHTRRHLLQVDRVRRHPDFPGGGN